jgi:hypothetical protein
MITFHIQKKLYKPDFRLAKERFLRKVGELLFTELFIMTAVGGSDSIGIKKGVLRRALRTNLTSDSVEVYFDTSVAPHALWVIKGTRYIKARPILDRALENVRINPEYLQAKQNLLKEMGLHSAN